MSMLEKYVETTPPIYGLKACESGKKLKFSAIVLLTSPIYKYNSIFHVVRQETMTLQTLPHRLRMDQARSQLKYVRRSERRPHLMPEEMKIKQPINRYKTKVGFFSTITYRIELLVVKKPLRMLIKIRQSMQLFSGQISSPIHLQVKLTECSPNKTMIISIPATVAATDTDHCLLSTKRYIGLGYSLIDTC